MAMISPVRDAWKYALAVLGYVVLGLFTKHFLAPTYGVLYFVLVLYVLPRVWHAVRSASAP